MENDKKTYSIDEIMEETRLNDPQQYEDIMKRYKIKSHLIEEYKKSATIPEFNTPEEFHAWQNTPAGKNHMKTIQKINKQADKDFKKQHGGARNNAGRKKSTVPKVKFTPAIPVETRNILKDFARSKGIPESEVLNQLIINGCKPDSPLFDNL